MLSPEIIVLLLELVTVALVVAKLGKGEQRLAHPLGSLGGDSSSERSERNLEQRALFRQYLVQQRWAFGLLWLVAATGAMLAATVLWRLVLAPRLDLDLLGRGIGLAADIWFGRWTWQIYTRASEKVEAALATLDHKEGASSSRGGPAHSG